MSESEIQRSLGRIEGKVDSLIARADARDRQDETRDDRIRNVERRQWWLSGAAAFIGAVLGIGGNHGLKL